MNFISRSLFAIFLIFIPKVGFSDRLGSDHVISFAVSAPPAILNVSDEAGRRTGANFDVSIRADGSYEDRYSPLLDEITDTNPDSQNIENDEPGQSGGKSSTVWTVDLKHIGIPGRSRFLIHLKGLQAGVADVKILSLDFLQREVGPKTAHYFFSVSKNEVSTAVVSISSKGIASVEREGKSVDLAKDINSICSASIVKSEDVCRVLSLLADEVMKAVKKGDCKRQASALRIFEKVLNKLHKPGHDLDWSDFEKDLDARQFDKQCRHAYSFHKKMDYVPSPAYEALCEDLKALRTLCKKDTKDHDRKEHQHLKH